MGLPRFSAPVAGALLLCAMSGRLAGTQRPAQVIPGTNAQVDPIPVTPRLLPECPVRVGGVYLSGLGATAGRGREKLSDENRDWIAANCDVTALRPTDIDASTFPAINRQQKLFTPLLYLYASSLYEEPHPGSVGGWSAVMKEWTLRRTDGSEAPHPEIGGHWMDFANAHWAHHWAARMKALTQQYGAYGAVAAELPLGNTFVGTDLKSYRTPADRAEATRTWLTSVRKEYPNLLVPSAIGFDLAANHRTPDPGTVFTSPALEPRLWNDYFPVTDGGWSEGWIQPYWNSLPVAESLWETQMQAADRAGRLGQVFIAGAAYRNETELEFALASYLLIVHNQGRVVFQPMPVRPGEPVDAGFSLATLKREMRDKTNFFRVHLGRGMQQRHEIPTDGGGVWRRNFQFGDVYVNSDEARTVTVRFAGNMRRVTGAVVRSVVLPPRHGAILLYTSSAAPADIGGRPVAKPATVTGRKAPASRGQRRQ